MIGPVLFIWLTYNVVNQVKAQPDLQLYIDRIHVIINEKGFVLLALVCLLMFLQWILEAKKWQLLLAPVSSISLKRALVAIFSGIAFSIATPNRMGEFAGRILHLPANARFQGTSFTFVGNFAQLIITLICGGFSLFFLDERISNMLGSQILRDVFTMLKIATPVIVLLSLMIYFKLGIIFNKLFSHRFFNKVNNKLDSLKNIPLPVLGTVLVLSFARFLIFIVQYYLLFIFTGVDIPFFDVVICISVLFLLLAAIPTITFLELGIRWQVALVLFAHVTDNKLGVSLTITAVWFINLILPAFLGALTTIKFKWRGAKF